MKTVQFITLMIFESLLNYFQRWQIYWQNKKGISSIGTQCRSTSPMHSFITFRNSLYITWKTVQFITLMIFESLLNYFQRWQIYWQNKKGISSIGTQCRSTSPMHSFITFRNSLYITWKTVQFITLMIFESLLNYFQRWQIYWQNKKGISSIGTQCRSTSPMHSFITFRNSLYITLHYIIVISYAIKT